MGTIRFLLALNVVIAHYGGAFQNLIIAAPLAVQMFYVISGYLISIVLTESSNYPRISRFYINRALRIYPIYIAVFLISLALAMLQYYLSGIGPISILISLPFMAQLLLVLSNLLLFFQDIVLFTAIQNNELVLTSHFTNTEIPTWKGLLVPQAWTLALELMFYLIAPFILRHKGTLIAVFLLSLSLKVYLYLNGYEYDPWNYRFFPAELSLFLLGAISHQFWTKIAKQRNYLTKASNTSALLMMACAIFSHSHIPLPIELKNMGLFTILFLSLPFIASLQKTHKKDAQLAELSYPIYISHFLVINALGFLFYSSRVESDLLKSTLIVATTILISMALNETIGKRVETLRANLRAKK